MHELPLLINISIALIVAFIGGTIARRIGLPTIVGYLLAGIIIGPFTPGFVGDIETIRQLAELGVIFLMFGVGPAFLLCGFMAGTGYCHTRSTHSDRHRNAAGLWT